MMDRKQTGKKKYLLAIEVPTDNKVGDDGLSSHITLCYWTQKEKREPELLEKLSGGGSCLDSNKIEIGKETFFDTPKGEKKVLLLKKSKAMEVLQEKVFEVVTQFSLEKEDLKYFGENWNPHISFYPDGMKSNKYIFPSQVKLYEKHPLIGNWWGVATFK